MPKFEGKIVANNNNPTTATDKNVPVENKEVEIEKPSFISSEGHFVDLNQDGNNKDVSFYFKSSILVELHLFKIHKHCYLLIIILHF